MKTVLADITKGRDNNLDLIRFIAAIMVIFSHAFPIAQGIGVQDPLSVATNDQISFGSLAVSTFFFYGGFLICKSMHRCKQGEIYFKARIVRIFPPLIGVTLVLTFGVGPIITSLSLEEYFSNISTYRYLLNGLLILQHDLPGVFTNNIYANTVNGPLWTLPIEFLCYIMCYIFYKLHLLEKKRMGVTIVLFSIGCFLVKMVSVRVLMLASVIRPVGLFFAGMLYFVFSESIIMSSSIGWLCLIGGLLSIKMGVFNYTIFVFLPYFLMYIGYGIKKKASQFAKRGEISYGVYLCAWPIQQIICQCFGGQMNPMLNFVLSILPSIIMGTIICKFVEEPLAKKMKR